MRSSRQRPSKTSRWRAEAGWVSRRPSLVVSSLARCATIRQCRTPPRFDCARVAATQPGSGMVDTWMTPASREADALTPKTEPAPIPATWMPARYREPWKGFLLARATAELRPGVRVLDVGSGARPTIPREQRPEGCVYVGLDVSARELERAEVGAYDEVIVADICSVLGSKVSRFDLVLSWQVLEHVASMRGALAAQHAALVPGGRMLAMLSGAWSVQALAARVIPYRLSTDLQARLLDSVAADKFPTRYDGCTDRALRRILAQGGWAAWEIVPYYRSGNYLSFLPPLQRLYVAYESWAARRPRVNLATHYIIEAVA